MLGKPQDRARLGGRRAGTELTIINAGFTADLAARGYRPVTVRAYGRVVEHWRWWLMARGLNLGRIGEECLARFVHGCAAQCRRRGWPAYRVGVCRRAVQRWWLFLRAQSLVKRSSPRGQTAQERLVRAYDRHLAQVRGLAEGTRLNRQYQAHRFLAWLARQPEVELKSLGPKEVVGYVAECARHFPVPTARGMASGLRCWLRFLAWRKQCRPCLDQAVPPLSPWPRQEVSAGLAESQYRQFLAAFDRSTALGRRDYALALCLGELGLRAGEAAALQLEDLDWRRQVLRLPQTKQGRERRLPLPPHVVRALCCYLRQGRPPSASRRVFVRHRPPLDQGLSRSQVGIAMSRAFARSGLSARGAHVLRYCLATRLQRRGVGLKTIADLLGHRSLESTARYARVDFEALRQAALPWPEADR